MEFRKKRHQIWKAEFQTKSGMEIRADLVSNSTTLHLASQLAGVDVFLDDTYIGKTPLSPQEINPGAHILRYDGSCSDPIEEHFVAKEGVDIFRELNNPDYQTPVHVKAINQFGKVLRARVYVDGDFIGYTPFHESISTCSNRIEVEAEINGLVQRRSLPLSLKENATEYLTLEFYQKKTGKKKTKKAKKAPKIDQKHSSYYMGYEIGQAQTVNLTGTLNGILNQQYQETGVTEYTTNLSPWINDKTLHGFEGGYHILTKHCTLI